MHQSNKWTLHKASHGSTDKTELPSWSQNLKEIFLISTLQSKSIDIYNYIILLTISWTESHLSETKTNRSFKGSLSACFNKIRSAWIMLDCPQSTWKKHKETRNDNPRKQSIRNYIIEICYTGHHNKNRFKFNHTLHEGGRKNLGR